jgi:Zn-dependent protease with chaperone function
MVTLEEQDKSFLPSWLASHPGSNQRIRYLESLIERNQYNRYAYEGVARHAPN